MEKRKLGKNGLSVSALGLGCMGISEFYGPTDEAKGIEVIHDAFQNGITFFDTADMYGRGANEKLLGHAIQSFRDQVTVATKCGIERLGDDMRINNTAHYIKNCCHQSLQNLNMNVIDLYYLHRYNPETPIEASMQTMLELIQEGKIRYVGLSEIDGDIIERAHTILGDKLIAVQSEYSLVNQKAAEIALPTCRKLGIGFVPFSPIARGLLTGTIEQTRTFKESDSHDIRSAWPQFQADALKINLRLVEAIRELAERKRCTPAQLSLAWLLAQGEDIVPIPGTKRLDYLKENVGAVQIHLSTDDLSNLEQIMLANPVVGKRYPEGILNVSYLKF